ncbi:hypothetical protein D9M70_419390 [compost metagenome]
MVCEAQWEWLQIFASFRPFDRFLSSARVLPPWPAFVLFSADTGFSDRVPGCRVVQQVRRLCVRMSRRD